MTSIIRPKTVVYDEKITPLANQIIDLCKEHGIAALMHFQLDPCEDEAGLYFVASSQHCNGEGEFPECINRGFVSDVEANAARIPG